MSADEGVCIGFVRVVFETAKAIRVEMGTEEQEWIPKTQIHDSSDVWEKDDEGDLWVSSWIADQKGWTCKNDSGDR